MAASERRRGQLTQKIFHYKSRIFITYFNLFRPTREGHGGFSRQSKFIYILCYIIFCIAKRQPSEPVRDKGGTCRGNSAMGNGDE